MRLILCFLFVVVTTLTLPAQSSEWVGFHHLSTTAHTSALDTVVEFATGITSVIRERNAAFSFGMHRRREKANGQYRQFDQLEIDYQLQTLRREAIILTIGLPVNNQVFRRHQLRIGAGYQRGRIIKINQTIALDLGMRVSLCHQLTLQNVFDIRDPRSTAWQFSLGLNPEVGLIWQVSEDLRLGYHIIPVRGTLNHLLLREETLLSSFRSGYTSHFSARQTFLPEGIGFQQVHLSYRW